VKREIVRENFEKRKMWKRNGMRQFWKKRKGETIKKCGKKILGEIVGEKKT
jgi:hypothetical protein